MKSLLTLLKGELLLRVLKLVRVRSTHRYFCFKGSDGEFILPDKYGTQWSNRETSGLISITKSSPKKAVKHLLAIFYFCLGNKIFRQITGILIGAGPAPVFPQKFSLHCQNKWIKKIRKNSSRQARSLLVC